MTAPNSTPARPVSIEIADEPTKSHALSTGLTAQAEQLFAFHAALDALKLPQYGAESERATAVSAVAGLFSTLRDIDLALCRARGILIVLQSNRDGRVDLRTVNHRSIEGARDYALIQWVGSGPRQYARKLSLQSAHTHVPKGARGSRRPYTMARTLTRRIARAIEVRRKVITAILALRRARGVADNSPVAAALAKALADFAPVALTMLAIYSSSPVRQIRKDEADKSRALN